MSITGFLRQLRHSGRTVSILDRFHARRAGRAKPHVAFVSQPEPRSIGSYAKGKQLVAGNLQFGGRLVEAPGALIWQVKAPDIMFEQESMARSGLTIWQRLATVLRAQLPSSGSVSGSPGTGRVAGQAGPLI